MHSRNHAGPVEAGFRTFPAARFVLLGLVAALWLVPALAAGDEAAPAPAAGHAAAMSDAERERVAEAIARSIMSPFCPGRTVSSCPNAGPWREDIRRWVGEGVEADEIKRRLAARFPEHDLAGVPKNRLGWVLPVGLGVGALGLLVFLLRYLVSRPASGSAADKPSANSGEPASLKNSSERPAGDAAPAAAKNGKDWDAQLDRELESLEN